MILTGKAKEDFLKWNEDNDAPLSTYAIEQGLIYGTVLNSIIIEWFDSVGIYIEIILIHGDEKAFTFEFSYKDYFNYCDKEFSSRGEAVGRAIVNVNEIYNIQQ